MMRHSSKNVKKASHSSIEEARVFSYDEAERNLKKRADHMSLFDLKGQRTTVRQEVMAGIVSFVTASYLLVVNPLILGEAGIPPELSVFSTIFITVIGCMLSAFWADSPLVLAPGMGENTFFTYTMVFALGFTWKESLAAVLLSGVLFMLFTFTGLTGIFAKSIPRTLKKAITAGIGLFLVLIGLQNSGLIVNEKGTGKLTLGNMKDPMTILALLTLLLTAVLVMRKVKGSFLIGILTMTVLSLVTGIHKPVPTSFSVENLSRFPSLVGAFDFSNLTQLKFILTVLSLTMLIVFETIGMAEGLLNDPKRSPKIYRATSVTAALSGILGTSPVVPLAESAAGIKEGGRTGLTSFTVGLLFLLSFFLTPLLAYIPEEALGPILVITGSAMMENLKDIPFDDFSEWFPGFLVICIMPFTGSVINGMAFGFISYVILKGLNGEKDQLNAPLLLVAVLFLLTIFSTAVL